ncbi:MAG: 5'-methylthioadenosine/adenosylhomocysteine nucleosidase [Bacillota bacterium]
MTIGVIGAMEVEIELLKDDMILDNKLEKAGMTFYSGTVKDKDIVLVKCGIGKVNAAICTQILIDDFEIEQLIFTGVAGAIDPKLEVEDIVISTDLIQHDVDASAFGDRQLGEIPELDKIEFAAASQLIELAFEAGKKDLENESNSVYKGRILSGDQFISSRDKVKALKEQFGGYCTEMEGAAVAQTAYLNQLPFVIIRSISDKADEEADVSFVKFVKTAAQHSHNIVISMLEKIN